MPSRRDFLRLSALGLAAAAVHRVLPATAAAPIRMTIYKSPTCGCCKEWVTHVEKAGFAPVVHDVPDVMPMKKTLGIPGELHSCHTAIVGRYSIEGHVPADLIHRILKEKPAIAGLAVGGMPQGSPGMETGRKDPYDVVAFTKAGRTSVYARR